MGVYLAVSFAAANRGVDHSYNFHISTTAYRWELLKAAQPGELPDYQCTGAVLHGSGRSDAGAEHAYTAEIIRGGFLGVDHGQYEAAAALGLPPGDVRCGSFCRKRCAPFACGFNEIISPAKGRRWFTCWRCRNCSTPFR